MTFGQLKLRMLKQFPGLDIDILEGFISDRYGEILEAMPWTRLLTMAVLQTTAPYNTGTVTMTQGAAAATLTGGAWDATMNGRALRVAGRPEYYEFTFNTATTATLDRPYEGPTGAGAGYSIVQFIYPLPANCRILPDDGFASMMSGELRRFTRDQLNSLDPSRLSIGTPRVWASYMDDGSVPPRMQIELNPIPDSAIGIPFEYIAELAAPDSSGAAFAAWMEPATALVEGVTAKVKRHLKDYNGAQLAKAEAAEALSTMRGNEAQRMPNTQMRLAGHFTAHRRRRW